MQTKEPVTEEIDLMAYARVLFENKATVVGITLTFVLIGALLTFLLPKTYESEAVIQLGMVYEKPVYDVVESKSILQSSSVLGPVYSKYYAEEKVKYEEFKRNLEVELVTEEISLRQPFVAPQLKLKFKADDAVESRDTLSDIITSFFSYGNERFDAIKHPALLDYNETVRLAELDYNKSIDGIVEEIAQRNLIIEGLEEDIADMEAQITSLESEELSTESLSKTILLRSILNDRDSRRIGEEGRIIALERSKTEEQISYEQKMINAKVKLDTRLAAVKEFKVVSSPQVPDSYASPKIFLNLAASLLAGLLFSCVLVIVKN